MVTGWLVGRQLSPIILLPILRYPSSLSLRIIGNYMKNLYETKRRPIYIMKLK